MEIRLSNENRFCFLLLQNRIDLQQTKQNIPVDEGYNYQGQFELVKTKESVLPFLINLIKQTKYLFRKMRILQFWVALHSTFKLFIFKTCYLAYFMMNKRMLIAHYET